MPDDPLFSGGMSFADRRAADEARWAQEDLDRAVKLLKSKGYRLVKLKLALTGGLYLIEEEL